MYDVIFFSNILRLLDERGWTKKELATQADISISFISDLTNGHGNPSLETMSRISHALGVPLPALLEHTDLDRDTVDREAGVKTSDVPSGYVRITAILREDQAFRVRKEEEQALKHIQGLDARK